jgi:hypothetical protein
MSFPLPSELTISELAFISVFVFFFALWGWRHGLDATIIAGLFTIFGVWAAPQLSVPLAKLINAVVGLIRLLPSGQFSMQNWTAMINAEYAPIPSLINVQDPNSVGMVLLEVLILVLIVFIGFRYANKKAGHKDPFLESVFGFIGAGVTGYIIVTFVLTRVMNFPQQITIEPSPVPTINVDAFLIIAVVLVLIVFGVQRSKPPAQKK